MARGSVSVIRRTNRDGKSYVVYKARVPGGTGANGKRTQVTKHHPTRRAADAWIAAQLANGPSRLDADAARMTVADLFERWLALHSKRVSPNTIFGYQWAVRRVCADLGGVPVATLSVLRVQAFYDGLGDLAPSSIAQVHKVLKLALDLAVDWELIARNPAKPTRRPGAAQAEVAWWRPESAQAFLDATREDFDGPLFALLLSTGMRIGEAVGLNWTDVDLERGTLRIERTMTRTARGQEVLGTTTKTKSSRRSLVLPQPALAALRRQRIAQLARRLHAGEMWHDSGAIFDRGDGVRRHVKSARDRFATLVGRCELPTLTPKGLRHTMATYLFHLNVPVKLIAALLGHAGIQITLDTYTHIEDADRETVARAIERALGGAQTG